MASLVCFLEFPFIVQCPYPFRVDCLMADPSAMVSFYPDIPEAQPPITCGEFVFLMDRSGSMQGPMSKQDKSQLRIEAAKVKLAHFFFSVVSSRRGESQGLK